LLWRNESHRRMMSNRMTGLNNPESNKTKFQFHHKDFGFIECTQFELRQRYKISHAHLSQVVSGSRIFANGWCLYKNRGILSHCNNRQIVFTHDFHESYKCKKIEIQSLFPHLEQSAVSRLVSGEYKKTKGWRIETTGK